MNILSEDGKSIVRLSSWEEVFARPDFQRDVNPKEMTLKTILGRYEFGTKEACGLSNCHTKHQNGYLVLCSNNIETNIGHKCGKKYFGVDFEHMKKAFRKDLNVRNARINIEEKICQLDVVKKRITSILQNGGNECFAKMRDYRDKSATGAIRVKLERRAKSGDEKIYQTFEPTQKEIEFEEVRLNRRVSPDEIAAMITKEQVGVIYGAKAFSSFTKIKKVLIDEIPNLIKEARDIDTASLRPDEILAWSKRLDGIEAGFEEIQRIIEDCKRFLVQGNLDTIAKYSHLL